MMIVLTKMPQDRLSMDFIKFKAHVCFMAFVKAKGKMVHLTIRNVEKHERFSKKTCMTEEMYGSNIIMNTMHSMTNMVKILLEFQNHLYMVLATKTIQQVIDFILDNGVLYIVRNGNGKTSQNGFPLHLLKVTQTRILFPLFYGEHEVDVEKFFHDILLNYGYLL